jgi:hypothetical protein
MKPSGPNIKIASLFLIVLGLLVLAVWYGRSLRPTQPPPTRAPDLAPVKPPEPVIKVEAQPQIAKASDALKASSSAEASRLLLKDLQSSLAGQSREAAVASIRQFLDSGGDAPTRLGFKIGAKGLLTEAPTLRVYLLDYLAQLDPAAAAAYAQTILQAKSSADEWAVALRNYALGNPTPEGKQFLQDKAREMLLYERWQKEPSVGFLEAFDVAVYAGGPDFAPVMADLVRQKDNRAVAHAAYLALDRMVLQNPAGVLGQLQSQPDLMQGREETRANYFARANVGDPQQKAVLESYLLNPQIKPNELQVFAGIYPNANYMISQNLLTPTVTPTHAQLVDGDQRALQAVDAWLTDPRFANLKPQLQTVKSRLEMFVEQAKSGH